MLHKTVMVGGDIHISYHHKGMCSKFVDTITQVKPDIVVLLGDVIDCYAISKFTKDPARLLSLQVEINKAKCFLDRVREACGDSEIVYLRGNHEEWWRKYLWSSAKELSCLESLSLEENLGLDDLGIIHFRTKTRVQIGGLLYLHGTNVRKAPGGTAKAHYEKYGMPVMVGHSHRVGSYAHRTVNGIRISYENGCMCDLYPEYDEFPDWHHSFSIVRYHSKTLQRFTVEQVV